MGSKLCSVYNIEKQIEDFYKSFTEIKHCNSKRGLKSYFYNKDKISNQRKLYYGKNKDKLLHKQKNRYIHFKKLVGTYIELVNRLKALEETSNNSFFC